MQPTEETALNIVENALSAPEFERSPRMRKLLRYLVDETVAGRGDRLKGYSIGVDVFEKPSDFDPNSDALVRVEVGRLRRILANHFSAADASISHAIEIPRGSYQVLFRSRSNNGAQPRKELLARPTGPQLIVHPFLNQAPQSLSDDVAVGLAAELVDQLSRFRHIFVQNSAHAAALKTQDEGHYEVSGTVALIDDRLRVVATLTDNTKSTVVWSREFRSPTSPGRVLATQREIAQMIAGAVGHAYGPVTRDVLEANRVRPPGTWEAWSVQAMWQSYRFHQPTPEKYAELRARVEELLQADPLSPGLIAILARMTIEKAWTQYTPNILEVLAKARLKLLEAVGHDPNSGDAWRELAVVESMMGNATAADQAFRRAMDLHPSNLDILFAYAFNLGLSRGEWHQAWPLARKVVDLGLVSPIVSLYFCLHHMALDEAKPALFEARKLVWDWHPMMLLRALAHAGVDDMASAKQEVDALLAKHPDYDEWGREMIGLWVKDPPLMAKILALANKAGLQLRMPASGSAVH